MLSFRRNIWTMTTITKAPRNIGADVKGTSAEPFVVEIFGVGVPGSYDVGGGGVPPEEGTPASEYL